MIYFAIHLQDETGLIESLGMIDFASLDAACSDARAAIPDAAADLIRRRRNPYGYAFLICDEAERTLAVVPFKDGL